MNNPKPNFNTEDFFEHFLYYSQLLVFSTVLRTSSYEDRFIHTEKSRLVLTKLLNFSEIHIKEILRDLVKTKAFKKGKRGVYFYNKELLR